MKNFQFILLVIIVTFLPAKAMAQYDKTDEMGFIISLGYKNLSCANLANSYNAMGCELSLHNYWNNIDFNGGIHIGKSYLNIEPFSLLGMLSFFFVKYGEGGALNGDNYIGLIIGACSFSSVSFNISLGDYFKIRPYWSLLRLSKIKDVVDEYTLNGGVGTHLSVEVANKILISPYCEYAFGYEEKSPFTGLNFGVSLGIKLY